MLQGKRLKKVIIPITILADKKTLMAILEQLPEDAILLEAFSMPTTINTHHFIFKSNEWDEIGEGEVIPRLDVNFFSIETRKQEETKKIEISKENNNGRSSISNSVNRCICDFHYTGLKTHKRTCPFFGKE